MSKDRQMMHVQPGDNSKYLAHGMKMWDWKKPDMMNPREVENRIEQYFQLCMDDDMKPSVEGLACAFNVHRKTIWEWATDRSGKTMPDASRALIRKAYTQLNLQMANYMQNGKINPVAGIFLMKNNLEYEDRREVTVAPSNPLGAQTPPEELQQKYIDVIDIESRGGTEEEK